MRIIVFWAALIVVCAGCSSLDSKMKSYVGHHRDQLIQLWGPPTQEVKLSTGGHSLAYVNQWSDRSGLYTCRKVFNTDEQDIIRSWAYSGCGWFP